MSLSYLLLRVGAPFVVGLLQIGLAIAIYRKKGGQGKSNLFFSLTVLSVAFWAIGTAMWQAFPFIDRIYISTTLTYFAASCIPYFFLLFTLNFPAERLRISRKELFLITIPVIIALLFILPDQVIGGANRVYESDTLIPAKGYGVYSLLISGYFVFAFINLYKKFCTTKGLLLTQVKRIFWATFLPTCIGITMNLLLPISLSAQYMWVGPVSTLILFFVIYNSMRRNMLFKLLIIQHEGKFFALMKQEEAKALGFSVYAPREEYTNDVSYKVQVGASI